VNTDTAIAALRDDLDAFITSRSDLRPRLGIVQDVRTGAQRATVLLAGDSAPTTNVGFGSGSVPAVGDRVVVFANGADYFIGGTGGSGGTDTGVVAPPTPIPVPTSGGSVTLWLWGDLAAMPVASADLLGVNFLAFDEWGGSHYVCNGASWLHAAPGVSQPPMIHGPEAHTAEVGVGGGSTDDQGDPTTLYWCLTEADLPVASSGLRRSFAVIMQTALDSPAFAACNGMSWVIQAYLRSATTSTSSSGGGSGGRVGIVKAATETHAGVGDAGLQDDADFHFPLAPGQRFDWTLRLWYDGDSAGDLHLGFAVPSGGHFHWGYANGLDTSATALTGAGFVTRTNSGTEAQGAFNLGCLNLGTTCFVVIEGYVTAPAGVAGDFKVRWSKRQTSTNDTRLLADSSLTYEPV
jgi:hypothetical protein